MNSAAARMVALMMLVSALAVLGAPGAVEEARADAPVADEDLVITEIMYDPEGLDTAYEWFEIYNRGVDGIEMGAWKFVEGGMDNILTLEPGYGDSVLSPGEYAVIAVDSTKFLEYYPGFTGTLYDSSFSLINNGGEFISMRNGTMSPLVAKVWYYNWMGGDDNYSIECRDPTMDINASYNWGSTMKWGGTPGELNSIDNSYHMASSGWRIRDTTDIFYTNLTVDLLGNLEVWGDLQLRNVTVNFDPSVNGSAFLRVMDGGNLVITDLDDDPLTPEDGSNLTSKNLDWDHQYSFFVNQTAGLTFNNSRLQGCGYTINDGGDLNLSLAGPYILADGVQMSHLDISHCAGGAVFNGTDLCDFSNNTVRGGFAGAAGFFASNLTMMENDIDELSLTESKVPANVDVPTLGIILQGCENTSASLNLINGTHMGVIVTNDDASVMSSNDFTNVSGLGATIEDSAGTELHLNEFHGCGGGISAVGSSDCVIHKNHVDGGNEGVHLEECDYLVVYQNDIMNMDGHGISAEKCDTLDIYENNVNYTVVAVQLYESFDCYVESNRVNNATETGILSDNASHSNDIDDNIINDTMMGISVMNASFGMGESPHSLMYNEISNSGAGVALYRSPATLYYNAVDNSTMGFYVNDTLYGEDGEAWLIGCEARDSMMGLLVENGSFVWAYGCDLSFNGQGAYVDNSTVLIWNSTVHQNSMGGVQSQGESGWADVVNSSITPGIGLYMGDLITTGDGTVASYNSTFSAVESQDGTVYVNNYLHIHVAEQETGEDLEGVDVLVSNDDEDVYNTTMFGGTDTETNARGEVRWLTCLYEEYDHSNSARDVPTNITVWHDDTAPLDNFWFVYRNVIDMSTTHVEEFEIDEVSPDPPSDLEVIEETETSVTLNWTASPSTDLGSGGYRINMNATGSSTEFEVKKMVGNVTSTTVMNLAPRTDYIFTIESYDEVPNYSTVVGPADAVTTDETPPGIPTGLRTDDVTGNSITVHWSPLWDDDLGGYTVYVSEPNATSAIGPYSIHANVTAGTHKLKVEGLMSETLYYFKVGAFDDYTPPNPTLMSTEYTSNTTADITAPLAPVIMAQVSPTNDTTRNIQGRVYKTFDSEAGTGTYEEAGATVTVFVNNVSVGPAEVSEFTGMFSVEVVLTEGMNYIDAVAMDNADTPNISPRSEGVIVILDTTPPEADAGADIDVVEDTTVMLDGGNSTDNLRVWDYVWTFMEGDDLMVLYPAFNTTYTTYEFNNVGKYEITLQVSDRAGNTAEDKVQVNVSSYASLDRDGDGLTDEWEEKYGLDPDDPDDADIDTDGDGLTNLEERDAGTDPTKQDTDGDGIIDKDELDLGYDPTDPVDFPPPPDLEPPEITSKVPGEDVINVAVEAELVIKFNEAVDVLTLNLTVTAQGRDVTGEAVWSADRMTLTWTPDAAMAYGAAHTVAISVADPAGNVMEEVEWTFTTIEAAEPPDGDGTGGGTDEPAGLLDPIGGPLVLILLIVVIVVVAVLAGAMAAMRKKKAEAAMAGDAFFKEGGAPSGAAAPAEGAVGDMGEGTCSSCGAALTPEAEYCPECGEDFKPAGGAAPADDGAPLGGAGDAPLEDAGGAPLESPDGQSLGAPEDKLLPAGEEGEAGAVDDMEPGPDAVEDGAMPGEDIGADLSAEEPSAEEMEGAEAGVEGADDLEGVADEMGAGGEEMEAGEAETEDAGAEADGGEAAEGAGPPEGPEGPSPDKKKDEIDFGEIDLDI